MIRGVFNLLNLFKRGHERGQLKAYILLFSKLLIDLRRQLYRDFFYETDKMMVPSLDRFEVSRRLITGLHEVLAKDKRIKFSILLEEESEITLQSARGQTAPDFEIVKSNPTGTHILFLQAGDCLRLDFLYRYEQVLRLIQDPNLVLFIGDETLHYPYEFELKELKGLLIPIHFYEEVKGLDVFQKPLKLASLGARFQGVQAAIFESSKTYSKKDPLPYFEQYKVWQKLDWDYSKGLNEESVKASPRMDQIPSIQVIIPFKDQKKLTLNAVESVMKSRRVHVEITCIDNRSQDLTIAAELEERGIKVLKVDEPFNYSRLNNLAAATSSTEYICFMNNDAEIQEEALFELARWAQLPGIGLVGARLNYPSGTLQHGGIKLDPALGVKERMNWVHIELNLPYSSLSKAKCLHIADAVTAAFCLVKRDLFNKVQGFDEISFPVAYSDTHLAQKLHNLGAFSLYTPYAEGVHHESLTRKTSPVEDFDNSVFWDKLVQTYTKSS